MITPTTQQKLALIYYLAVTISQRGRYFVDAHYAGHVNSLRVYVTTAEHDASQRQRVFEREIYLDGLCETRPVEKSLALIAEELQTLAREDVA